VQQSTVSSGTGSRTADGPVDGLGISWHDRELPLEARWRAVLASRASAPAAVDDDGVTTYGELEARSEVVFSRLRACLERHPTALGQPVVSLTGHDRLSVVASMALLKCGQPGLTLDPSMPVPRLAEIVQASGARIGVASPAFGALAREIGLIGVVVLDEQGQPAREHIRPAPSAPWAPRTLRDIQGITYTSGSTGRPKGVAVRQLTSGYELDRRAADDWCRPSDVVGMIMPLTFGVARGEMTAALMFGAAMHFYDPRDRGVGPLVDWLAEHRITMLAAPPSLLGALVRALPAGATLAGSLRMVRSSGEKVLCSEAVAIRRALPAGCRLLNAFGSSEATLITSFEVTEVTPDTPVPLPCGWPLAERDLRIEDEDGELVPVGERGELVVTSRYLPAGYWRDEALTRSRYTELPDGRVQLRTGDLAIQLPNGAYRLAGRKDLGLKIRGNLVEPAEVESALLHLDGVREAVVVGRPGRTGGDRLVAYIVPQHGGGLLRSADLRRGLRERLPSFMVPELVVYLAELPRNDRGKLDRAALPAPPERRVDEDSALAQTSWQRTVAEVWQAALDLEVVGLDEDFFDLGGDSLSAEELVTRLGDGTGVVVSSRLLLDAPTLREFAAAAAVPRTPDHPSLIPIRRTGTRTPLFCVAGAAGSGLVFLPLARALGADQPVWALQSRARERRRPPELSVVRMARRHVAAIRSVAPHGPYVLAGHSFGAIVAYEMAQQLRRAGETVDLLVVLDSFAPHPSALPPVRRRSAAEWRRSILELVMTSAGKKPQGGKKTPFVKQSRAVSMFYRGKPYAGRALVLIAGDEQPQVKTARAIHWPRFLPGDWTTEEVAGTHRSMLREPDVRGVAASIGRALSGRG
jgi:acyl-coenzyme A synthetase/AMP-(fatty) acid ligase/surfactin synthase thioesterase subunit